ncbi:MAG: hypothetical protein Q8N56_00745, partial [bacterium]|nr:hypothetical protein [bacterium]
NWNDLWWWYGVIYEDGSLYLVPHFRGWALLVPAILLVAAWYNWPKKESVLDKDENTDFN